MKKVKSYLLVVNLVIVTSKIGCNCQLDEGLCYDV